jgi:hypothetical protein
MNNNPLYKTLENIRRRHRRNSFDPNKYHMNRQEELDYEYMNSKISDPANIYKKMRNINLSKQALEKKKKKFNKCRKKIK